MLTQRSREEIISMILQSAELGSTRTTLMYETYLSHGALKEYLTLLLEKGLLQYLAGEMKFKTTADGLRYLSTVEVCKGCSHQCKKCGILYFCEDTRCHNPFYHGVCQVCLKVSSYEGMNNQVNIFQDKTHSLSTE